MNSKEPPTICSGIWVSSMRYGHFRSMLDLLVFRHETFICQASSASFRVQQKHRILNHWHNGYRIVVLESCYGLMMLTGCCTVVINDAIPWRSLYCQAIARKFPQLIVAIHDHRWYRCRLSMHESYSPTPMIVSLLILALLLWVPHSRAMFLP